jgi:ABC-type glycerol-3-phosphate transport system substrate-binding protein
MTRILIALVASLVGLAACSGPQQAAQPRTGSCNQASALRGGLAVSKVNSPTQADVG